MNKKEIFSFFIGFVLYLNLCSQNLVPNSSFESYIQCPLSGDKIYYSTGWFQPNKAPGGLSVNQSSSSDYFNSCSDSITDVPNNLVGYQNARTGNAYIGLTLYSNLFNQNGGREYAEIKLNQELLPGRKYIVKYYVSMANESKYSITKFDAHLSHDSLLFISSAGMNIPAPPQIQYTGRINDTLNWVEVSNSFIAIGGENFLTIGNFHNGNLCDSMSNPNTGTIVCCFAYYYIDDVSLEEDTITGINDIKYSNFEIYPNPSNKDIQIKSNQVNKQIRILDLYGKNVLQIHPNNFSENIDVSKFVNGVYLIECEFENGMKQRRKIVVQH